MKKIKMLLNCCIPIVLITVTLMTPAITQAGSIKIRPDQLILARPNANVQPFQAVSNVSDGYFYSPLILPVGAKIIKVTYYHVGFGNPVATSGWIYRNKFASLSDALANGSSTDATTAVIPVDVPLIGDPIIRKGYQYMILLYSANFSSSILGAKIDYQE